MKCCVNNVYDLCVLLYRAFADRRGKFITDNNLAYVKPVVIQDKQHYVCSENTL